MINVSSSVINLNHKWYDFLSINYLRSLWWNVNNGTMGLVLNHFSRNNLTYIEDSFNIDIESSEIEE